MPWRQCGHWLDDDSHWLKQSWQQTTFLQQVGIRGAFSSRLTSLQMIHVNTDARVIWSFTCIDFICCSISTRNLVISSLISTSKLCTSVVATYLLDDGNCEGVSESESSGTIYRGLFLLNNFLMIVISLVEFHLSQNLRAQPEGMPCFHLYLAQSGRDCANAQAWNNRFLWWHEWFCWCAKI